MLTKLCEHSKQEPKADSRRAFVIKKSKCGYQRGARIQLHCPTLLRLIYISLYRIALPFSPPVAIKIKEMTIPKFARLVILKTHPKLPRVGNPAHANLFRLLRRWQSWPCSIGRLLVFICFCFITLYMSVDLCLFCLLLYNKYPAPVLDIILKTAFKRQVLLEGQDD